MEFAWETQDNGTLNRAGDSRLIRKHCTPGLPVGAAVRFTIRRAMRIAHDLNARNDLTDKQQERVLAFLEDFDWIEREEK